MNKRIKVYDLEDPTTKKYVEACLKAGMEPRSTMIELKKNEISVPAFLVHLANLLTQGVRNFRNKKENPWGSFLLFPNLCVVETVNDPQKKWLKLHGRLLVRLSCWWLSLIFRLACAAVFAVRKRMEISDTLRDDPVWGLYKITETLAIVFERLGFSEEFYTKFVVKAVLKSGLNFKVSFFDFSSCLSVSTLGKGVKISTSLEDMRDKIVVRFGHNQLSYDEKVVALAPFWKKWLRLLAKDPLFKDGSADYIRSRVGYFYTVLKSFEECDEKLNLSNHAKEIILQKVRLEQSKKEIGEISAWEAVL